MTNFSSEELRASMVVHLSPRTLANFEGVQTNAAPGREASEAPEGKTDHYFLLLRQEKDGRWLCMPLFSKHASGNEKLDEAKKSGEAVSWLGINSYVSPYQHWLASSEAIVKAQINETSRPESRRSYAAENPEEIQKLIEMVKRNKYDFRSIGVTP